MCNVRRNKRLQGAEIVGLLLEFEAVSLCSGRILRIALDSRSRPMMELLLGAGISIESCYEGRGSSGGVSDTFLHDATRVSRLVQSCLDEYVLGLV